MLSLHVSARMSVCCNASICVVLCIFGREIPVAIVVLENCVYAISGVTVEAAQEVRHQLEGCDVGWQRGQVCGRVGQAR